MNQVQNLPELMANKFGQAEQLIKLLEELGECTAAVSRMLELAIDDDISAEKSIKVHGNFLDEIIDVEFLFAQMRYYFDGFVEAKKKNDEEIQRRFFQ